MKLFYCSMKSVFCFIIFLSYNMFWQLFSLPKFLPFPHLTSSHRSNTPPFYCEKRYKNCNDYILIQEMYNSRWIVFRIASLFPYSDFSFLTLLQLYYVFSFYHSKNTINVETTLFIFHSFHPQYHLHICYTAINYKWFKVLLLIVL